MLNINLNNNVSLIRINIILIHASAEYYAIKSCKTYGNGYNMLYKYGFSMYLLFFNF